MGNIINQLAEFCAQHLTCEKILVMPSYAAGRQLLQSAALEGISLLNLKVETPIGLASKEVAAYLLANHLQKLDPAIGYLIFLQLLEESQEKGQLKYFHNLELTGGVVKALYRAILDLRLAGYHPSNLSEDIFLVKAKAHDLLFLLERYEDLLKAKQFIDKAGILELAAALLDKEPPKNTPLFIIPIGFKYSQLEVGFLNKLTAKRCYPLYFNPVYGLDAPGTTQESAAVLEENYRQPLGKENRLSYLFNLEKLPENLTGNDIKLSRCYGEGNEVKGVLREIKKARLPLEQVLLLTTSTEPYTSLIYDLARKLEIPVTYGEGYAIDYTTPGQLYFALLKWFKDNFNVSQFYFMLTGGLLKKPDNDQNSLQQMARLLRKAGIGWNPDRYGFILEKMIKEYQEKLNSTAETHEREQIQQELELCQFTRDYVGDIIKHLAVAENNPAQLVAGLYYLIDNYADIKSQGDAEACSLIKEELNTFLNYYHFTTVDEFLLDRLQELIAGKRVGSSLPKPGHIHLTSFRGGLGLNRKYIFVMGLDAGRFPGQSLEDPVLLDKERQRLSGLELKKDSSWERGYEMARLLANTEGKLYCSYSCYDTLENRENAPSAFFLQLGRLVSGNENLDYTGLNNYLKDIKGFLPEIEEELLDEAEYWLVQNFRGRGLLDPLSFFQKIYPETAQGYKSFKLRYSKEFNEYNGKLKGLAVELDPRCNQSLVMSASRLEQLAACPYSYFLKYVLRINPPEEISYDPSRWLDPLSRGSLLHKIYEEFYREIQRRGEKPFLKRHLSLIYQLAEENLQQQRELLPPPGEMVYEREAEEIRQSCYVFLASESDYTVETTPVYFELAFGTGNSEEGLQFAEPVEMTLPGGQTFKLRGRIDRVDRLADNSYQIIDYKTGSTYGYSSRDYFKGGLQLQHALYALALEKLLGEGIKVKEAGYFFPSLKGQGQRFMRGRKGRKRVLEIVEGLFEALAAGSFPLSRYDNKQGICGFCDYQPICCREKNDILNLLWQETEDKGIELLRGLAEYE